MTQTHPKTPRADQFQGEREAFQVASADTVNAPKRTKRIVSAHQRRAEIVIAALFLVTAATSIPAAFILDPILNASGYLAQVFPNRGAVKLGALMWSINNIGIVFIAVFAFGVLRKLDEALAVGYLASLAYTFFIHPWTAGGLTTTRKTEQNGKRGSSYLSEISAGHRGTIPDVPSTGGSRKNRWHAIFFETPISWMPSAATILLMARYS